jgi:hypothetical protein
MGLTNGRHAWAGSFVACCVALFAPACNSIACNDFACISHFQLTVTGIVPLLGARTTASAQFCIEDRVCQTYVLTQGKGGWSCAVSGMSGNVMSDSTCSLGADGLALFLGGATPFGESGNHAVTLVLSDAKGVILSKTDTMAISATSKDCPPVCDSGASTMTAT